MAELKSRRWLELLIIPLVVGLIIALFAFGLPKIFQEEKEISYKIDSPSTYLNPESVGDLEITIDGIVTKSLLAYKVEFWNSGDIPLKKLPVRYVFSGPDINFIVLTVIHKTQPEYEFGEIREEGSEIYSKRFVYSLLNPGERVTVTFLCTGRGLSTLSFYTKLDDLSVKQVTMKTFDYIALASVLISILAAFLGISLSYVRVRLRKVRIGQMKEALAKMWK